MGRTPDQAELAGADEQDAAEVARMIAASPEIAAMMADDDAPSLSPEEAERGAGIDHWRNQLQKSVTEAQAALHAADSAWQMLTDGLYDVEFAEGYGGDVAHHLDAAMKALRAADALRHRAVTPTS